MPVAVQQRFFCRARRTKQRGRGGRVKVKEDERCSLLIRM